MRTHKPSPTGRLFLTRNKPYIQTNCVKSITQNCVPMSSNLGYAVFVKTFTKSVFNLPVHVSLSGFCGAIRFLLHAEEANFLYLVHLGDFSQRFSVN